jgi:hypothetical protein
MPLNKKEYMKEYHKEHYKKNREQILERVKEYYENNKEKIAEYKKDYGKEYKYKPQRKKSSRISHWKDRGIITDDYNFLYDWYISINNCLICNVELVEGAGMTNQRNLDHDHITGQPCIVVCGYCNLKVLK